MVALSVEYVQMNLAVSKKGCAVLKPRLRFNTKGNISLWWFNIRRVNDQITIYIPGRIDELLETVQRRVRNPVKHLRRTFLQEKATD